MANKNTKSTTASARKRTTPNTNKSTKPMTVAPKVEEKVEEVVEKQPEVKPEAKPEVKTAPAPEPKSFQLTDMIMCKSVTFGRLIYTSKKTGLSYIWEDYGDVQEVQYSDLLALKSSRSAFLFKPYFIILDSDLVNVWAKDFERMYSIIALISNMDEFLSSDTSIVEKTLAELPDGLKNTVQNYAADMIRRGELDSVSMIQMIDNTLNCNLKSLL